MYHLSQEVELNHESGMGEAITELESLTRGHHIGNNWSGSSEISGSLPDRAAETSIYGKGR